MVNGFFNESQCKFVKANAGSWMFQCTFQIGSDFKFLKFAFVTVYLVYFNRCITNSFSNLLLSLVVQNQIVLGLLQITQYGISLCIPVQSDKGTH